MIKQRITRHGIMAQKTQGEFLFDNYNYMRSYVFF